MITKVQLIELDRKSRLLNEPPEIAPQKSPLNSNWLEVNKIDEEKGSKSDMTNQKLEKENYPSLRQSLPNIRGDFRGQSGCDGRCYLFHIVVYGLTKS